MYGVFQKKVGGKSLYAKKRRSPVWETPRAVYAAGKNILAYAFLCAAFWPASRPKVTLRPAAQPASRFG